jgi:thioredoxin-dependent peroxiredoxin
MALAVGSKAPDFITTDTNGKTVSLSDFAGKTVIMYFYPKDDTPGCTKQACSFRDSYNEYLDKDIVVLGVSKDNEIAHQKFTQKFNLPFPLLADVDGSIIKAYDVEGSSGYAQRVTYTIDGSGTITNVDSSVKTESHAQDVLASLK